MQSMQMIVNLNDTLGFFSLRLKPNSYLIIITKGFQGSHNAYIYNPTF